MNDQHTDNQAAHEGDSPNDHTPSTDDTNADGNGHDNTDDPMVLTSVAYSRLPSPGH